MNYKELYEFAYNFLLTFENVTESILERHLVPDLIKPKDLNKIYFKLCESAQNRQMSAKVIGQSIGGIENLKKLLFEFDPKRVSEKYKKNESNKLLIDIISTLKPKGQLRTTNRSIWPQFCKSIIDSAYFLNSFDNVIDFYDWADFFIHDKKAKLSLPLLISAEIHGIGFPLACDFLKEIGYIEYSKPDTHLRDIFFALNIVDNYEKSIIKQDFEILQVVDKIAFENNTTPYAVDKVFWLIGSGNFYSSNIKIGGQKQKFIDKFKSIIS
ncbi:hypothetical protein SDC9_36805 [bioreactor metagenome]|jgi:hypothetical protein|uniref:Uncharacterized protein n=1 Tax=bioreactor metagenome TaxID=1076179 RepID=A0A644VH85_9ZZZZ|nr:hypothetical protein [Paludibacter sp.]